ncbi:MAG: VRR-NUC domain-containing protein [Lachnospiraceae bacterium]|nr:VRR-NUC domain-containing protein [Lachnospiraceae bacterium]
MKFEDFKTKEDLIRHLKENGKCRTTEQAERYIRDHLPKEAYYQDRVIKHIRALIPSAFVWKAAAGTYSRQGIPDVCAVINGRYYGFEIKRPFVGILSAIQKRTIEQIREAGGQAYVVTYPEEVTRILREEM